MRSLNGEDLAGFIKERQERTIIGQSYRGSEGRAPKLLIIKDSENPVIEKYVAMKQQYGADIGANVEVRTVETSAIKEEIARANEDSEIDGMIVQLPLTNPELTDDILSSILPEKDVDGLIGEGSKFVSATAEAIVWLLNGYNIELKDRKIAMIGRGRLVGKPLAQIFSSMKLDYTVFTKKDSLETLVEYDVVITATGATRLIKPEMLKEKAVVVDAGTTSEDGGLVGDLDRGVRSRKDLTLTPKVGGVGPLTVAVLFEHLLQAYTQKT
jgi:methylenetetrahydrofolate dehydrogenase (NADP+)/methenyltetrahydrofolate cyclohydrolase